MPLWTPTISMRVTIPVRQMDSRGLASNQSGQRRSQRHRNGTPLLAFEDTRNSREQRSPHLPASSGQESSDAYQDRVLLRKCGPRQMRLHRFLQTHGPRPSTADPTSHRLHARKAWLKCVQKAISARKRVQRAIHDHKRGKPFWTQRGQLAPLRRALRK